MRALETRDARAGWQDDCTLLEDSSRVRCEAIGLTSQELATWSVMVYLERDVSLNTNQAAPKVYNRIAARPSSPEPTTTSCCVRGAPNHLGQSPRAVAAPEKPPAASFQPTPDKDSRANKRRTAFRRVSSTHEYTASHNTHAESRET